MNRWTEKELIIAFSLYCQMPFGKIHSRNPVIQNISKIIERTPSALAMKMLNFSSLDPEILKSGRSGLGNASQKDKEIWDKFHDDWDTAVERALHLLDGHRSRVSDKQDFNAEDVVRKVKTRSKQGFFRNSVLSSYNEKCCISGLNYSKLLVASHILPWSVDQSNRLNPRNGLCLSVLYDKAFDLGLITISTDYRIQVSEELKARASDNFSKENLHKIEFGQHFLFLLSQSNYSRKSQLSLLLLSFFVRRHMNGIVYLC